jgi:hypothetical protein
MLGQGLISLPSLIIFVVIIIFMLITFSRRLNGIISNRFDRGALILMGVMFLAFLSLSAFILFTFFQINFH